MLGNLQIEVEMAVRAAHEEVNTGPRPTHFVHDLRRVTNSVERVEHMVQRAS